MALKTFTISATLGAGGPALHPLTLEFQRPEEGCSTEGILSGVTEEQMEDWLSRGGRGNFNLGGSERYEMQVIAGNAVLVTRVKHDPPQFRTATARHTAPRYHRR